MAKKLLGIIIAAIVAMLLMPAMMDSFETNIWITKSPESVPEGWQYDDYELADSTVSSASGALELVTLAGEQYLHAKGVGQGVITYSDSTTETVTVNKAILDFYCFNGQSNSTYRSAIEESNPDTASPYPSRSAGYLINMFQSDTEPMAIYDSDGDPNIGGNFPSFMADYYEETGRKVLVISAGVGGRSILKFQPGNEMYERTLTAMNSAYDNFLSQTEYYEPGKKVMIWIQGEADNDNMTADTYCDYFMTFWNSIQSTAHPFDYCMISLLASDYPVIKEADLKLIEDHSEMYLGSEVAQTFTIDNGLLVSDGIHYSQEGRNLLGASLAESADYLLTHQKVRQSDAVLNLYKLVPLMFIIALLVGAAAAIYSRRD